MDRLSLGDKDPLTGIKASEACCVTLCGNKIGLILSISFSNPLCFFCCWLFFFLLHTPEDMIVIGYTCLPCQSSEKFYSDAVACFEPLVVSRSAEASFWARGCVRAHVQKMPVVARHRESSLLFLSHLHDRLIFLCTLMVTLVHVRSFSGTNLPLCSWSNTGVALLIRLQNGPGKSSLMLVRGWCWIPWLCSPAE